MAAALLVRSAFLLPAAIVALALPVASTAAPCPCSLFSATLQPAANGLPVQDGRPGPGPFSYEFGLKFTVDEATQLTDLRFYKQAGETGVHTGKIWSTAGILLARVDFAGETASGWQQQRLAAPLQLQAGTVYLASVNANAVFGLTGGGLAAQISNPPLRSVADGQNGVYGSVAGVIPNESFNSSNYFVDVVVGAPQAAPTVSSTVPANGATGVATGAQVRATFSRAMNAATIASSSFTLAGPGGAPVAAAVAYDAPTNTATLTPSAPLAAASTYAARLETAITAADGAALAAPVSWSFTTVSASPTVSGLVPADGSNGIAVTRVVTATFSRLMDTSTLTASSFTLTGPSGPVAGAINYGGETNTVTLTPTLPLAYGTVYTARLDTTVKAADGVALAAPVSWSFTIVAQPTVTSTAPADGATGVVTNAQVRATFSRAMDGATITPSSFTLTGPGGAVAGAVAYDGATDTATLTPTAALAAGTAYTARLEATVKAADGAPLAAAVSWTFTTAAAASPSAPTVTSRIPAGGATGVPTTTSVKAVFSAKMDAATINAASFTLTRIGDGAVAATVSYDAATQTATLKPAGALAYSTTYVAALATTVKASDGAPLASAVSWSFTTIDGTRINAGDGAVASAAGPVFQGDAFFAGGSIHGTSDAIDGTSDPKLYQDERWGRFSYAIPVASGVYDVRLHFAELYYPAPCVGARVFGVDIVDTVGSPDIAGLDICAAVGPKAALMRTLSGVSVTDGFLNIEAVYGAADDPEVAAIEVVPAATGGPVAPTVSKTAPAAATTGVATNTKVTAVFSQSMDPATITTETFTLAPAGGAAVPATVSYNSSTRTATLTAGVTLAFATSYTATLTTAVKGSGGTPLPIASSWRFTTVGGTRINSGDGAYTASDGRIFAADSLFSGGSTHSGPNVVTGTPDPVLYQNERWGQFTYNVPVANGTYTVTFHFVELYYGLVVAGDCVGKRVFGMDVVNTPASPDIANLDICAEAGGPTRALVKTVTGVQVTNGTLSIKSSYGPADDPEVAAIEVTPG